MKLKTTEQFIEDAKKAHGDRYDYSEVNYISSLERVTIICEEHGVFQQTPKSHLFGRGCPECGKQSCANSRRKTTKQFIEDARKIHGDKYDYSCVEYVNSETKITIICPKHGEFERVPSNHLNGNGCPKCQGFKTKGTLKQFIEEAKRVHENKYDYSESVYVNSSSKIKIICSVHGEFMQTPYSHVRGAGCPECRSEKISVEVSSQMKNVLDKLSEYYSVSTYNQLAKSLKVSKSTLSTWKKRNSISAVRLKCIELGIYNEIFNEKAKKVNNKNNLIFSDYTLKLVEAAVLKEGEDNFQAHLLNLLQKANIEPYDAQRCKKNKSIKQFIENARKVHGDKYDYSKVKYVNNKTKITINCSEHGEFMQIPNNHLRGNGCPSCSKAISRKGSNKGLKRFLSKINKLYGDKYDFSLIKEYRDTSAKVKIICPKHNVVEATCAILLSGAGCPECHKERLTSIKSK